MSTDFIREKITSPTDSTLLSSSDVPIGVPTVGIAQLVQDSYAMCEKYQWAREALVNSIEAGATWVFFGVDRQGLENMGIARRYVADNGHGMTSEQMEVFLSMFAGGGKEIGFDANRGVGLKASAYPWNTYGLVVISWTEEEPEGALTWIRQRSDGVWVQRGFDIYDEDGSVEDTLRIVAPYYEPEIGVDFRKLKTREIEEAGHGVVVMFLGDSPERHTEQGDWMREEESVRGIAQYLNSRMLTLPEDLVVKVEGLESGKRAVDKRDRDKPNRVHLPKGKTYRGHASVTLHARTITGLRSFIPTSNPSKFKDGQSGTIMLPFRGRQVEVEWFYHPEVTTSEGKSVKAINGDVSYGPGPRIVYRYDQRNKYANLSEAYVTADTYQAYRNYGVSAIRHGLWMIVHIPEWSAADPSRWGVMPQQSRAALVGQGGIPQWSAIVEDLETEFWARAGDIKAILRALETPAPKDEEIRSRLKRTIARLADRMRPVKYFEHKDGKETGALVDTADAGPNVRGGHREEPEEEPGTPPVPRPGPKRPFVGTGPDRQKGVVDIHAPGSTTSTRQRQSDGIPTVKWDVEPFRAQNWMHLAVMFDPKGDPENAAGVITLNPEYPMFESEIEYWGKRWDKADPTDLRTMVKNAYAAEAVSKVQHLTKMRSQTFTRPDGTTYTLGSTEAYKRDLFSAWALTTAIVGLINVEQHLSTTGGSRFGAAATTAKDESSAA